MTSEEEFLQNMAIMKAGLDQLEAFLRESVIPSAISIERLTLERGASPGLAESIAYGYAQMFLSMIKTSD